MRQRWKDKDITVLGFSKSGIAAAEYLAEKGANCIISDSKTSTAEDKNTIKRLESLGIKIELGEHKESSIINADIIITSPGIPPHSDVIKLAKKHNIAIFSEIDVAFLATTKPFIAITGTNGKTTVTKLVSEIFQKAGFKAPACGNIGYPAISAVAENPDFLILEISSYQIATSKTFRPQIAAYLNYTADHVDWHGSEEEYFNAKASLFTSSSAPVWAVLNASDSKVLGIASKIKSKHIYFNREHYVEDCVYIKNDAIYSQHKKVTSEVIKLNEIPLIGNHNHQNVMAAVSIAVASGIDLETIKNTIIAFKSPEHRIEFVETIDNIDYFNDSKATNTDSAICALNAFDEKVVLIAGGKDKGTLLNEFVKKINEKVASVILIGEAADRFENELKQANYNKIYRASTLEEAIDKAHALNLGSVLFSPACASFDMFKNYEERGHAFKNYVYKKKQTGKA
ncbi:MAG: UDP-N-acetylmuramoyl-L-alanine--D-glutamate ligase [bacterium]